MKRKLLSICLIAGLLFSVMPGMAFAADGTVAKIGDESFTTLEDAFDKAAEMAGEDSTISRDNPVEIQLESDVELSETILPETYGHKELTYHVKLNGNGYKISRADNFEDTLFHVAQSSSLYLENITLDGSCGDGSEAIPGELIYLGWTQRSSYPVYTRTHDNYVEIGEEAILQNNRHNQPGALLT